jgi:TP901 family phage tail tape measure protein
MAVANFAVLTKFRGLDQVSKPMKKITLNTAKFGREADKSFKKASKSAFGFRSVLGGILGAGIISGGIMQLKRGVGEVTDEFIKFDQAAVNASAKFKDGMQIGSTAYKQMKAAAREVGAATKFTAAEAQEGIEFLAMAGFTGAQAIAAIAPAAELATAGNLDLARSTDIASDVLSAFDLRVDNTSDLLTNMTRVNNVLSRTVNSANTNVEGLFETMKFGGPAAAAAGQDLETVAALAGAMGDKMIKNSMAGTTMRTMFTSLAKPTREASNLIKKLNLNIEDEHGNFNDIMSILGDFNRATKDMGERQRLAAIKTIFGKRAISGMKALLDKGEVSLRKYREEQIRVGKSAADVAKEMNKGLGFRLKALQSAAIEVGFKFIDVFEKKIPGVIESATNAVRNFDVKAVIRGVQTFATHVKHVWQLVKDLSPVIIGAVGAFTAFKVIMAGIAIFQFVAGIQAAGGAFAVLNAIMAANPVGLIALAIGGLIALIVLLVKNWDTVSEVIQEFWIDTKIVFGKMWDWLKKMLDNPFFTGIARMLNPFLEIPMLIIKHWEPVKKFFVGLFNFLKPGFDVAIKAAQKLGGFIGLGGDDEKNEGAKNKRKAPNEKEVASKSQIDFMGRVMFENAPPGTRFEGETKGAPPIMLEHAGANP